MDCKITLEDCRKSKDLHLLLTNPLDLIKETENIDNYIKLFTQKVLYYKAIFRANAIPNDDIRMLKERIRSYLLLIK